MYTQHSAIYQSLQLTSTPQKPEIFATHKIKDCKPLCHRLCACDSPCYTGYLRRGYSLF